jgi:molecular chaperone DnaK (HSP70)
MGGAVGIDLGTTISMLAGTDESGRIRFATTRDGGPRLRSVVAIEGSGVAVGEEAVRVAPIDPESCFAFFKRSMGTDWEVEAGGRRWRPEDLSAEVLRALVADAAATFGEPPDRAILTIPAYFGDDARRATLEAARLAGLDALGLIHEPTAACFGHGVGEEKTVLVYDLGGGTFDVSVVRREGRESEVLATLGDHRLGGKDWDDAMAALLVEALDGEPDPRDDAALLAELEERAREAKHALSRLAQCSVNIATAAGLRRVEVTRQRFFERTAHLFDRTEGIVARVLEDIGGADRIDEVLLVGGSTRMPPCAEVLERLTGARPAAGIDPDEAVARGAAIAAAEAGIRTESAEAGGALARIRDVTAHALGFVVVAAAGDRYVNQVMIARNAPIPASASKAHSLALSAGGEGALEVHMLQGEAQRPLDNQPLGCWRFVGIEAEPGPRQVEVAYEYDRDGIVQVSASVEGRRLADPEVDRLDRDLSWTDEDPGGHRGESLSVALVIDVSSSMVGRPLEEAKAALAGFIDVLEEAILGDRIALVSFSSSATPVASVGAAADEVRVAAQGLSAAGSTNMAAGLELAGRELAGQAGKRVVVLLTDGQPNDSSATLRAREQLVRDEVDIVARGVHGADLAFLKRLATVDGEILELADLAGGFRGIARQLAAASGDGLAKR